MANMGTLYVVATPIGNLADITYRAVDILKQVPLIAAEDTRTTQHLLDHYQISTQITSYHDHNKNKKTRTLLNHLESGDVALVSDAGTPGINDPGFVLIRAALDAGYTVTPIPGPSAPIAALSAAGLPTDAFTFLGYIPRTTHHRKKLFQEVETLPRTLVFLASPHRLTDSLQDLARTLGPRQLVVARELTKVHEEIFRGNPQQALTYFKDRAIKGEITLIVAGATPQAQKWSREKLIQALQKHIQENRLPPSKIAKHLAEQSGWKRRKIYDLLTDLD